MKVYALHGTFDCEGSYLIGVYTTKEKALAAQAIFIAEEDEETSFDDYIIEEREIDAKASF